MLIKILPNPDEEYQRLTALLPVPKRMVFDSAAERPVQTISIPHLASLAALNGWVINRYPGLLEKTLDSTASRAEEI